MAKKKTSKSKTSGKKSSKKVTAKAAKSKKSASKKTAKKAKSSKVTKKKVAKKAVTKKTSKAASAAKSASNKSEVTPASVANLANSEVDMMVREGDLEEAVLLKKKSGLKKKELKEFRAMLLEKRAEIVGDVASMQSSRGDGGNLSHMPVHMADVGSDNYEQEFTLGLMESERKLLEQIDGALDRMERGYYGICLITGHPIERPRLEIKPWAKYCIAVVRSRERLGYR